MVIQSNPDGIMTLDVGAEQYAARTYNQDSRGEGVGFLRTPIPKGIYGAAYLLLHRESDSDGQSAMGFGLRPPTRNAGELKNVYVEDIPKSAVDEGVSVRPVPALGEDWFLARVPLNPVTLQWYRDDGTVFPGEYGEIPESKPLCLPPVVDAVRTADTAVVHDLRSADTTWPTFIAASGRCLTGGLCNRSVGHRRWTGECLFRARNTKGFRYVAKPDEPARRGESDMRTSAV